MFSWMGDRGRGLYTIFGGECTHSASHALKTREKPWFSGGIEMMQWREMGQGEIWCSSHRITNGNICGDIQKKSKTHENLGVLDVIESRYIFRILST